LIYKGIVSNFNGERLEVKIPALDFIAPNVRLCKNIDIYIASEVVVVFLDDAMMEGYVIGVI